MVVKTDNKNNSDLELKKHLLHKFFNPKSVAIVGASKNPNKNGNHIVLNIKSNGFEGKIYPVNPNYSSDDELFGHKFYKSILDIEDEIDLVILYVSNKLIPNIIRDCVGLNVKSIIIQAAGFEEVGEEGLKLRDEIKEITENFTKLRIMGPNGMGLSRIDRDCDSEESNKGFFCGFGILSNFRTGNIALITQSGMLQSGYLRQNWERYPNMGFKYAASIGNKMDLGECDFIEYFLEDPVVNVILVYLESFKDPRRFIELSNRVKTIPNKSIVLLKGGSTSQGQKASSSHTGSLAENEKLINGVIRQAGVTRANSFHELFQYARTLSFFYRGGYKWPVNGNVAAIISSGGYGTSISDLSSQYGLTFPNISPETYETFKKLYPPWMPPNTFTLQDIFPAAEYQRKNTSADRHDIFGIIYDELMEDPRIDGLFQFWFANTRDNRKHRHYRDVDKVVGRMLKYSKPIFYTLLGSPEGIQEASEKMGALNVPSFLNTEELVKNFAMLMKEAKRKGIS